MRTVLGIGIFAIGCGAVWLWIHAATRNDDEATEIADYFYYAEALEGDE